MLISTMLSLILMILISAGFADSALKEAEIGRREALFLPLSVLLTSHLKLEFGLSSEISAGCLIMIAAALISALKRMRSRILLPLALSVIIGIPSHFILRTGSEGLVYTAALLPAALCLLPGSYPAFESCAFAPVFSAMTGIFISLAQYGDFELILSENEAAFTLTSLIFIVFISFTKSIFNEKRAFEGARPGNGISE